MSTHTKLCECVDCNKIRALNIFKDSMPQDTRPRTPRTPREILNEIADMIEQRGATHGDYRKNFQDIADRWMRSTYATITPIDVAYMMCELKLSRANNGNGGEPDHLKDIIGYAVIGLCLMEEGS